MTSTPEKSSFHADYSELEARTPFSELVEAFQLTPADISRAGGDMYQAIANKNNVTRHQAKTDAFFWMYGPVKK